MQISKLIIENFRSIEQLEISFSNFNCLVGSNNAGKSTILKAIEIFFEGAPKISVADHFLHDTSRKIAILAEFGNLTPQEREEFSSAVKDGTLRIVREFGGSEGEKGEYSVFADTNTDFEQFREESNGTKKRSLYAELRRKYPELPAASGEEMEEGLRAWEDNNPTRLQYKKIRGFFGAKNVASGKLKKKTGVRFVPAVKETLEEATDARKSPVIALLNEIVKQTFENRSDFIEFISQANARLAEITDPSMVPQLSGISDKLTATISKYYAETSLVADLNKADEISVNFPNPVISVLHRGLKVDVGFVGHGLQRAIFFSLVQFLAEEQSIQSGDANVGGNFDEPYSDIILLIEEPEIYQHPLKQSLFYESFKEITAKFNKVSGIRMQIIFATHSEKFVQIRDIDKLRLIAKVSTENGYETTVRSLSMRQFSEGVARAKGASEALSDTAFSAGLHIFSREVSEGFFADKIVLVEGVSDKAILEGVFLKKGVDPYLEGISIIQVDGKTKIDKPLFAFKAFGIPVYPVFDNDRTKGACKDPIARNKILQTICGAADIVEFPVGVFDTFACFDGNLERYLRSQIGEDYPKILEEMASNFQLASGDITKTPAVVSAVLARAGILGYKLQMLDDIVQMIRRRE